MFKNKTKICIQNQRFCCIFALTNPHITGMIPATDQKTTKYQTPLQLVKGFGRPAGTALEFVFI